MLYVTYNKDTRCIERIDDIKMIFIDDYLVTMEADITFDDDICFNANTYKVDDEGNFYIDEELVEETRLNSLRAKREPLLEAFDIYKSNYLIGALNISDEENQEILSWYKSILDLDETAINNPPKAVARYL